MAEDVAAAITPSCLMGLKNAMPASRAQNIMHFGM
jgi:hypothetical protein